MTGEQTYIWILKIKHECVFSFIFMPLTDLLPNVKPKKKVNFLHTLKCHGANVTLNAACWHIFHLPLQREIIKLSGWKKSFPGAPRTSRLLRWDLSPRWTSGECVWSCFTPAARTERVEGRITWSVWDPFTHVALLDILKHAVHNFCCSKTNKKQRLT